MIILASNQVNITGKFQLYHSFSKCVGDQNRWFSLGTPASSTTKTGRHDITEILLKVALKHQKSNQINQNRSILLH
jgi:hypothetical protein